MAGLCAQHFCQGHEARGVVGPDPGHPRGNPPSLRGRVSASAVERGGGFPDRAFERGGYAAATGV